MAIIDRIRFDAPSEEMLVWRYPGEQLRLGSQLVVNQSQEAVFVKKGEALDVFGPGTHTLSTGNLPLLHRLVNLSFGGDTSFTAEVWFVNKTVKRDLKWGTKAPIPIIDSVYNYTVNVRAYGRWGLRITDSRSFVTQMVGTLKMTDTARIEEYFIVEIDQKFSDALSEFFESEKSSVFQANAQLNELSTFTGNAVTREFQRYGIEIVNFNIERISIPEEEMEKFQELLGKRMESDQIGGAGVPVDQQVGQSPPRPPQDLPQERPKPETSDETDALVAKLKALKKMLEDELITNEEYEAKKKEILEKF
ncbi:SPFH domain-containing protein [candidate division WOR-3 bacterium]|nr:SPFH domain-containing protein [candidate division WOR-3 bacterium]